MASVRRGTLFLQEGLGVSRLRRVGRLFVDGVVLWCSFYFVFLDTPGRYCQIIWSLVQFIQSLYAHFCAARLDVPRIVVCL